MLLISEEISVTDKVMVKEIGALSDVHDSRNISSDISGVSCNFATIIDGEYIDKDKNGNNISMFMAFDIYVYETVNVTKRIFNKGGGMCWI